MFILTTGQINTVLAQNTETPNYQFSICPAPAKGGICPGMPEAPAGLGCGRGTASAVQSKPSASWLLEAF